MRVAALVFVILTASSSPALSSLLCKQTEKFRDELKRDYSETLRAVGVITPKKILEIYASPRGSFTVTIRYFHGHSCSIAIGSGWSELDEKGRLDGR